MSVEGGKSTDLQGRTTMRNTTTRILYNVLIQAEKIGLLERREEVEKVKELEKVVDLQLPKRRRVQDIVMRQQPKRRILLRFLILKGAKSCRPGEKQQDKVVSKSVREKSSFLELFWCFLVAL